MEGRRLILNDGTSIEGASCGYSEGFLWLWLPDFTMQEAIEILFNSEKTARIVFEYGEMSDEYTGFTVCVNVGINSDNVVSGCLKRGE